MSNARGGLKSTPQVCAQAGNLQGGKTKNARFIREKTRWRQRLARIATTNRDQPNLRRNRSWS
jgi:hypothetical protein